MSNGINPKIRELLALRAYANKIEFFNNQRVSNRQSGDRLSLGKGRGMDFHEVRPYQPSDDIRLMHWPLTARLGKPFTKVYREERERSIYLLVDQSVSMQFGTRVCFKHVLASRIASLLGFAALNHHDQIGGIVFNDTASAYISPNHGRKSLLNLFNFITKPELIKHNHGGLKHALQLALKHLHSGAIVIIISDYFTINQEIELYLNLIARKSKLINLFVYDPLETKLPDLGTYSFTDNGNKVLQIGASRKNNQTYQAGFLTRLATIKTLTQKNHNMRFIQLATNDDLIRTLNNGVINRGS